MTRTVLALMVNDFRLQWRYGVVAAYGVVVGIYVLVLILSGDAMPNWLAALLIYSDPSVLGFFFLGGLMMLEMGEGVRTALATSPVTASQYLIAKTFSLTALALLAVIAMGLAKTGPVNWPLLLAGVTLTSVFFIALGAVAALRFRTVNAYFIGASLLMLPLILPAIAAFLDPMPTVLGLIPTIAQPRLVLLALGYGEASAAEIAMMVSVLVLSSAAALLWSRNALSEELGRK